MPIYEYHCRHCGETVEKIQRQAQTAIACPSCGQQAERGVSVFASAGGDSSGGCAAPSASGFG